MITEHCIKIHKEKNRFSMVSREELKAFLEELLKTKIPCRVKKSDLVEQAYSMMSPDTIVIFEKLKNFGLARLDIAEVLDTTAYRVDKLIKEEQIRKVGEYTTAADGYRITYHIYSISDVIKLGKSGTIPKRQIKKLSNIEATDLKLAEALYLINKSAKKSRDTKNTAYVERKHNVCHGAKTRMLNLYHLKDVAINKMISDGRMKYIGINRQILENSTQCEYFKLYEINDFYFHMPCRGEIAQDEVLDRCIEGIVSAEKTREVSMNFVQALDLLESYTGQKAASATNKW